MKYLVTGGAGFIGSHLSEELTFQGNEVTIIDDLSSGKIENIVVNPFTIFQNIKVQSLKIKDLRNFDGIFHLAAQASVPISISDFYSSSQNNLLSSLKVFQIAEKYSIPVVYASSSAVYGNLSIGDDLLKKTDILSPYALDKLVIEQYAELFHHLYNISSIGLRFFNVYGPKQDPTNPYSGVISIFINNMINNIPIRINGGKQTRDFVYVKDVCNVLIKAMNYCRYKSVCEYINVGTGISYSIDTLYYHLSEIFQYKPAIIRVPLPKGDPRRSGGRYSKLTTILDIDVDSFTSFLAGLKDTVIHYRN